MERFVTLDRFALPVRESYRVSVVFESPSWRTEGLSFGAKNHTGNETVSDITVLGTALCTWRLDVGIAQSILGRAAVPTALLAVIAFTLAGRALANKMSLALSGALVGAVSGFVAWIHIEAR
jgi:hypothetical protein